MKYRFIETHRATHRVEKMAALLGVSRSGYYAWKKRPESLRKGQEKALVERIRAIQARVKDRYGSPRITGELARAGQPVGHNRVARLLAAHALGAKPRKRYRVTTKSGHDLAVAENLLERQFAVQQPNRVWVSDLTYLPTGEGWRSLAVVLDLHARRVVGWALDASLAAELVVQALLMACLRRRPPKGVLFHLRSRGAVRQPGLPPKAHRQGHEPEHEPQGQLLTTTLAAEAFFKSMKSELIGSSIYPTRQEARTAIFSSTSRSSTTGSGCIQASGTRHPRNTRPERHSRLSTKSGKDHQQPPAPPGLQRLDEGDPGPVVEPPAFRAFSGTEAPPFPCGHLLGKIRGGHLGGPLTGKGPERLGFLYAQYIGPVLQL